MKIIVDNASKKINGKSILQNISLELDSGRIYGLRGPNGSGKTMLLRLIAGLIQPTSGKVIVDGQQLGEDIDFPNSMGVLIENPAFLPNYTGYINLKLLANIQNRISADMIRDTIARVGLDPNDKRKFRKYSLGMKQRLGIAAAIMEKPELILLDEPTNALDKQGIELICKIIAMEKERGALIVLACHDNHILTELADDIYIIEEGKLFKEPIV